MATLAAFRETRDYFSNYFAYKKPLTFDEWVKLTDEQKVAVLFLQFYNEIVLAWSRANNYDFIEGEEGVTTIVQYLQKHVCDRYIKGHPKRKVSAEYFFSHLDECEERRILEENPAKFNPAYIYRIAYNSLYCICHDLQSVKDRWDNETSRYVNYNDSELDLLDAIADTSTSVAESIEYTSFEEEFWRVIEDEGTGAAKVMRYLLSGDTSDLKKLSSRDKDRDLDPLKDVEVTLDEVDNIIRRLRSRFLAMSANSHCGAYIARFKSLLEAE